MDHIGIDLHKRESQICVLSENGTVSETRIRTDRGRFTEVLGHREPCNILLESSTESEWVARHLESLGHEVIVADPNYLPMYGAQSRGIKTDKRDARALAEACRSGVYRRAHRLSESRRRLRSRWVARDGLVKGRARLISVVRAQLRGQGWRINTGSAHTFVRRARALELDELMAEILEPVLSSIDKLTEEIKAADKWFESSSKQDEELSRLCSMPSIGPVTASAFASVIDDAKRFAGPHQAQAYLGLVPREMSSGDKKIRGRITKRGNTRLRALLVQAALSTMRLRYVGTARLWLWAEGVAKRRGKRIAVVALARRIAGILYAMMRDQSHYLPISAETPAT